MCSLFTFIFTEPLLLYINYKKCKLSGNIEVFISIFEFIENKAITISLFSILTTVFWIFLGLPIPLLIPHT